MCFRAGANAGTLEATVHDCPRYAIAPHLDIRRSSPGCCDGPEVVTNWMLNVLSHGERDRRVFCHTPSRAQLRPSQCNSARGRRADGSLLASPDHVVRTPLIGDELPSARS